jgi:lipopolysaccharide/colanic/teichoic acid biosynthesis glycosyltransferase
MILKRLFDTLMAVIGLTVASPVLLPVLFLVWRHDGGSPFYLAPRVARGGGAFRMVKIRSMRLNADRSGVNSTAKGDSRITPVGHFIRRYKLDELSQLWNVLAGEMSLVGPRPQVAADVARYTAEERGLLAMRPGITDFASIVFSDEGEILEGQADADLAYNQLIRPWKSRLGLFYIAHRTFRLDVQLIVLTVVAVISRPTALAGVSYLLAKHGAAELAAFALRQAPLVPTPPPGAGAPVQAL